MGAGFEILLSWAHSRLQAVSQPFLDPRGGFYLLPAE